MTVEGHSPTPEEENSALEAMTPEQDQQSQARENIVGGIPAETEYGEIRVRDTSNEKSETIMQSLGKVSYKAGILSDTINRIGGSAEIETRTNDGMKPAVPNYEQISERTAESIKYAEELVAELKKVQAELGSI